jgi:hypothetical protein
MPADSGSKFMQTFVRLGFGIAPFISMKIIQQPDDSITFVNLVDQFTFSGSADEKLNIQPLR